MRSRVLATVGLGLAGVLAAAAIGIAANEITGDSVGLSAEPLAAGEDLAPEAASQTREDADAAERRAEKRKARARARKRARERDQATGRSDDGPTETPAAPAPPAPSPSGDDNGGDDNSGSGSSGSGSSGSGSDDSGGDDSSGRGRGRGRGGDD
jgi:hypothetical protein